MLARLETGAMAPVSLCTPAIGLKHIHRIDIKAENIHILWGENRSLKCSLWHCEGVILWYSLTRDGVEIFRHSSAISYRDSNTIVPYHSYQYQLRACNSAGCATSPPVNNCQVGFSYLVSLFTLSFHFLFVFPVSRSLLNRYWILKILNTKYYLITYF